MIRKKLLYVARPQSGGMAGHLRTLIEYFSGKWDVALAAPSRMPLPEAAGGAIKYFELSLRGDLAPLKDLAVFWRLVGICRQKAPSLVHVHGFKAAAVTLPATGLLGCPVLVTVHNSLLYPGQSLLPLNFFRQILKALDPLVSRYIAVSWALRQELEGLGIDPAKIDTIYNGIDTDSFAKISDFRKLPVEIAPLDDLRGIDSPNKRAQGKKELQRQEIPFSSKLPGLKVGTAGRLVFHKGFDLFIRAAAKVAKDHQEVSFFIAGEGPERSRLEELCNILGMRERIIFLGHVSCMPEYLSGLDIYVQPSRSEGLSLSLLEAGAAGLPLIASAVGGIPEIIRHGETGILFPPENVDALEKALSWLISQPTSRQKLGDKIALEIKRRFAKEKMLKETERVYEEVVSDNVR